MYKKYEMIKEGRRFRIRALKDFGDVKAGDIGGLIEKEENLSHEGNCWIYDQARVLDNARVLDSAIVGGNTIVSEHALIFSYPCVHSGFWKCPGFGNNALIS